MSNDIPAGLLFVNPREVEVTYRVCLWAVAGEGKTLAAATAPGPILVVNADRPSAWAVARRRHPDKDIRETRYLDHSTLDEVYRYLGAEGTDVATVVIDPWSNVYDQLVAAAPKVRDNRDNELKPSYELVNSKLLQFITRMRRFDVHLVILAHEKANDSGKKADGRTYPRLGGMGLIQKVLAEMDIVGHVEHTTPEDGESTWYAQIQPTDDIVGKDGTDALGERRVVDLTRWFELARAANVVPSPDTSDLPWDDELPSASQTQPPTHSGDTGDQDTAEEDGLPSSSPRGVAPTEHSPAGNGDLDGKTPVGAPEDAASLEPLAAGESPIDAALEAVQTGKPLDTVTMAALLNEDDWSLLELLAAGHTAASAAEELDQTPAVVRAHVNDIKKVLGQTQIVPIVALAREMLQGTAKEEA